MSRTGRRKPLLSEPGPPLSPLPPPNKPAEGAWRLVLPMLLIAYLAIAILHACAVPFGQTGYQDAPDEAAHMAYIHAVAQGRLPTWEEARRDPTAYEWHQPPLYYWIAACFLPVGNLALRCVSIAFGLAAILLVYRGARLFRPNDPVMALLATGLAALTPSHIAILSAVNNDALLEVCFSAALLLLITSLHGGFTLWRAGWLGVAVGGAILTKLTGLLLLPVCFFTLFLLRRSGESPRDLLRGMAWMLVITAALCGWWFVRNVRLYGELAPLHAFARSFEATVLARDVVTGKVGLPVRDWTGYWLLVFQWTFQSFWAVYGTPQSALIGAPRFLPAPIYEVMASVSGGVAIGLVRLHLRSKTDLTQTQRYDVWICFATIGLVLISFIAFVSHFFQTQARYLYPAMLPICLLFALGWQALFPTRYSGLACGMLLAVLSATALAFALRVLGILPM